MSNLHNFPEYAFQSASSTIACSKCSSARVVSTEHDRITVTHVCSDCQYTWYECVSCTHKRAVSSSRRQSIFDSMKGLKRHKTRFRNDHTAEYNAWNNTVTEDMHFNSDTCDYQNTSSYEVESPDNNITNVITHEKQFWDALDACSASGNLQDLPNIKYSNFYEKEQTGNGAASLVAKSQNRQDSQAGKLDPGLVLLHLQIADLALTSSSTQKTKLCQIFKGIDSYYSLNPDNPKYESNLKLPTTDEKLRSTVLEGTTSIRNNIPSVPVINLGGGHSYSSLIDIISDIVASGRELDISGMFPSDVSEVTGLGGTLRCQQIYLTARNISNMVVLPLYITLWSDDFEPSNVKQNKASLWVLTCSISPPSHLLHTSANTYIIAMGPKKACHDIVWEALQNDLKILNGSAPGDRKTFYHSGLKKNIHVHAEVHSVLQDSPERRGCNYVCGGNSQFTASWGHSIDLVQVASNVPSCETCLSNRIDGVSASNIKCTKCVDWNVQEDNQLLKFIPPSSYPIDAIPSGGDFKIDATRITYESLISAAVKTHDNIITNTWEKKQGWAYLSVAGWNGGAKESILLHASNKQLLDKAIDRREQDPLGYNAMMINYEEDPSLFAAWKPPPIMLGPLILDQFVEAPMHIMFLNNCRNTVLMVNAWMKLNKKFASFVANADGRLEQIQCLSLSFCKALPFGLGTLGGFVSENHMALARVGKWFFASVMKIVEETPYVEPLTEYSTWLKEDLKAWLKARHLPYGANKQELYAKVKELMEQIGGPPGQLPPMKGNPILVKRMISSMSSMVAHLMTQTSSVTSIESADRHLKIYLSCYSDLEKTIRMHSKKMIQTEKTTGNLNSPSLIDDIINNVSIVDTMMNTSDVDHGNTEPDEMDSEMTQENISMEERARYSKLKKEKQIPDWVQKYCIIGLANIINDMNMYGTPRMLWEGSAKGEGILKEIKPLVRKSSPNYIYDTHVKFNERKGLNLIMSTLDQGTNNSWVSSNPDHIKLKNDFRQYKKLSKLKPFLDNNQVISVVGLKDGRFVCILNMTNSVDGTCVGLIRKNYVGNDFGCHFFSWQLGEGISSFHMDDIEHCCLFLPAYPEFDLPHRKAIEDDYTYYAINSQWKEMNGHGVFVTYEGLI